MISICGQTAYYNNKLLLMFYSHYLVVSSDDNNSDSSSSASDNGVEDFLTRRVQHSNNTNKGQVHLIRVEP